MVSNHRLGEIGSTKALEQQPGLRGLKTRYFLSASNNWIRRKHQLVRTPTRFAYRVRECAKAYP